MSAKVHQRRRGLATLIIGIAVAAGILVQANLAESPAPLVDNGQVKGTSRTTNSDQPLALDGLKKLSVKGRAPKTGYSRDEFGNGWAKWQKCDTRQRILARDLVDVELAEDDCTVLSGMLDDPYTGKIVKFKRGTDTSSAVQIDHVVALSDAWQKGAQNLDAATREALANDDLELIAVEGKANMEKSDGDAATWLPKNKAFRCQYIARQIAVKIKYSLWITEAEHDAMTRILNNCSEERLPAP
jgi:hypothetical protein